MQDITKINWALVASKYDRIVRGPITDDLYAANASERAVILGAGTGQHCGLQLHNGLHITGRWDTLARRPVVGKVRLPGHYTAGSMATVKSKRYLDPATGVLYDEDGDRCNGSSFQLQTDGTWRDGVSVFTLDALLVQPALPTYDGYLVRHRVTFGVTGDFKHLSDATAQARALATKYPGTAYFVEGCTHLDTAVVTTKTQTIKSWEK